MATITVTPFESRKKDYAPIMATILEQSNTLGGQNGTPAVEFFNDVNGAAIITEMNGNVTVQAYTPGAPTAAGTVGAQQYSVTPKLSMTYDELNPLTFRHTRFNDESASAWDMISGTGAQMVVDYYAMDNALAYERLFWGGISSATKTAIAALTAGPAQNQVSTAEQALAAATTANAFAVDGIIPRMIYNAFNPTLTAGVGGRIKVTGATITTSNIDAEYAKLFAAVPSAVFNSGRCVFYVPRSHKQMIMTNNTNQTYRDKFSIENGRFYYNTVELFFVHDIENVMVAGDFRNFIWITNLLDDYAFVKLDKIANNQEMMFLKTVASIETFVANQGQNVLYA